MQFYPSLDELLSGRDKERLLVVSPTYYACFSLLCLFVGSVLVLLYLTITLCGGGDGSLCSPNFIRVLGLIPLVFLAMALRFRYDTQYILGEVDITGQLGRISFSYEVPSIRYTDIKGVVVDQPFWGRIFDYGDVELGTAASAGNELIIRNVRAPSQLAALVEALRSWNVALETSDHV